MFTTARVTLSIVFLAYASWSDYKTREVTNRVWVAYAPIAFALTLTELAVYARDKLPYYGLVFALTSAFALLLFYSGGFGGADSKALMCIALSLPFYPASLFKPLIAKGASPLAYNFFPLTILSNAVVFAAASAIYMLLRNVLLEKRKNPLFEGTLAQEPLNKKLIVLITGYKLQISKLKEKWHIYPLEDIEDTAVESADAEAPLKRRLLLVPQDEGRDEVVKRLSTAVEAGKIPDRIWATPGLPMLIFITAGLVTALILGDLVWSCLSAVLD